MSQVLVEGWIDIRHSYAIVLRNLVRHWAADPAKHWRFRSTPYLGGWRATTAATDEVVGQARSREWDGRATDVVFRAGHPDTRRPPFPAKVILFLTSESQVLEDFQFAEGGVAQFVVGCREGWLEPLVPSAFSAVALERAGVQRFHLIPLGVDTRVFRPVAPGPPGRPFTFLSVGAMTANKGIDMLLRAFHAVHKAVPETRLILKGLESIYRSTEMFEQAFARFTATWKLPPAEVETLRKALVVRMDELDDEGMATLYAEADCYVAPYIAEGFCLPALEAAASGLVVLASRGGPTDEFLPHDVDASVAIATRILRGADGRSRLVVDEVDLVSKMRRAIADEGLRARARRLAPERAANYDWRIIAERTWQLFTRAKGAIE